MKFKPWVLIVVILLGIIIGFLLKPGLFFSKSSNTIKVQNIENI